MPVGTSGWIHFFQEAILQLANPNSRAGRLGGGGVVHVKQWRIDTCQTIEGILVGMSQDLALGG